MVRVLLFHYFKSQRVFFDSFQPTSITSTKDYLFLATGEMKVSVYSLELPNFPLFCQFPTISKPLNLICNERAKCVVTIERKTERRRSRRSASTHSRAYFNWFKANLEEPVRTYVAGHSLKQSQEAEEAAKAFLALEIPTQFNVSDICCCPTSGNVAIAGETRVSLFRWNRYPPCDGSSIGTLSCDLEHFLDIEPSMSITGLALSDSYLALRSNLDVQVLKLVFRLEQESMSPSGRGKLSSPSATLQNRATTSRHVDQTQDYNQANDDNCTLWSFDDCSLLFLSSKPPTVKSPDQDFMFSTIRKEKVFKDFSPEPKEVLGPVSDVPGHPVTVVFGGLFGVGIAVDGPMLTVKGVTMLYRRFRAEQLSNDGHDTATLHTLQLLPTYTQGIPHIKEMQKSPLVSKSPSDPTLCGMCFLISGPKEGFLYDVFDSCKLLSFYKYTCDTISVSVCSGLLHAITRQGIETYTVRMYAAASDWVRGNAVVDVKLDQRLSEEHSSIDQLEVTVNMMKRIEESCQDLQGKSDVEFSVGSCDETTLNTSSVAVCPKSVEPTRVVCRTNGHVDQEEPQNTAAISVTDLPSSASGSNTSSITVSSETVEPTSVVCKTNGHVYQEENQNTAANISTDDLPSSVSYSGISSVAISSKRVESTSVVCNTNGHVDQEEPQNTAANIVTDDLPSSASDSNTSSVAVFPKSVEPTSVLCKTDEHVDLEENEITAANTVNDDLPSSESDSNVSNYESVDSTLCTNSKPPGKESSKELLPSNSECEQSPSDVTLTVNNSGRMLVRFTSESKAPSPALAMKEGENDSESSTENETVQRTRTFASVSLGLSGSSGTRLSETAYFAAVNKLTNDSGWTLPVFDLESLRQRCPPSSLDVCLIGMYPFSGSQYVLATEERVVLLTRASHDALHRSKSFKNRLPKPQQEQGDSRKPDWTVYVLQNMESTQLYKAVMPLASRCQKHNAQAYQHLVCEQHMFLRNLCLASVTGQEDKKRKKVKKLLCESAANLAELYARIPSVYQDSADYFNMTGLSLRDIVNRTYHKSGQTTVAEGLIHFLDEKLLGSDEPVIVSENTAKRIFKLYSKGKPECVAEIILVSSLSGFSSDTALSALEDLKKAKLADGGVYSLSPLDNLVRAVLYLHQCEPDHAQAALFSIPKKKLVEVLTTHYYLLHEDGTHFTPLAQLLRKHQPAVFLEGLLQLHDKYILSLDTLLTVLGASRSDAHQNELAIRFMEAVLNDKGRVDSFAATVIPLCSVYLERIRSHRRKRQSTSSHQHVPKGEGHFGPRHLWLNKVSPFQGSLTHSVPGCPCSKTSSPQCSPQLSRSSLFSGPSRRGAGVMYTGDTSMRVHDCCCCCCNQDLLKLQALLCSKFVSSDLCNFVLRRIEDQRLKDVSSVLLLCLPHVNRYTEAVAVILEDFPEIILPYADTFFDQDVEKWSHLLKRILDLCKEGPNSDDSEFKKESIVAVLRGTLQQLCTIVTPSEFLSLLPNDGCIGFFLPYLQQCYSRCASDLVNKRLVARTRQLTS